MSIFCSKPNLHPHVAATDLTYLSVALGFVPIILAYVSALPLLQGDEVQPISLKNMQLGSLVLFSSLAFCLRSWACLMTQLGLLDDSARLA